MLKRNILNLFAYITNSKVNSSFVKQCHMRKEFSAHAEDALKLYPKHGSDYSNAAQTEHATKNPSIDAVDINDTDIIEIERLEEECAIVKPCKEDLSLVAPYIQPSFNFAAYVNKSKTLQELVKLGVDLHILEKKKGVPDFILRLDFDNDIKDYIRFLHDLGVQPDDLGKYFTKSPYILKEDLENLQVRVNYLQSKNFSSDMITRIINANPSWLLYSTTEIDSKLGYFQNTFKLHGYEVRSLAVKQPRLITYNLEHVQVNTFSVKEEMGFTERETKCLLMKKPRLWMKNNKVLLQVFNYVHNTMKLSHEQIIDFPQVLTSRVFRVKQRHKFLEHLGRAQYNPTLEGYISPEKLVRGTDTEFCQTVARSSVEAFNIFLKSL